jgi:hypothetical protein
MCNAYLQISLHLRSYLRCGHRMMLFSNSATTIAELHVLTNYLTERVWESEARLPVVLWQLPTNSNRY